ncbi:hypothetical protein [Pontimicrobium sp. MEBiC01747]
MKIYSYQIKFKDFFFALSGIIIAILVYMLLRFYTIKDVNILYTIHGHQSHYNLSLLWLSVFVCFFFFLLNVFYLQLIISKREIKQVTESMRYANTHILNTFIYQTQILTIEASEIPEFNKEVINVYNKSVDEALIQSKRISSLKKINEKAILDCLTPN